MIYNLFFLYENIRLERTKKKEKIIKSFIIPRTYNNKRKKIILILYNQENEKKKNGIVSS